MKSRGVIVFAVAAVCASALSLAVSADELKLVLPPNDYPTVDRADYVFACMQTNGQTRTSLEKCSCSVDEIAALLPYEEYIEASTIMSVVQRGGDATSLFNSPQLQKKVHAMKLAQVEAELRCC
jgi:hypothetical protein